MSSTLGKLASLLLVLTGGACTHYSTVQTTAPGLNEPPRGIVVAGQGEAKAPPDVARVNLGVESRMPTVEQATADANGRANAIVAALKQAGIADQDLRTHNFSINFEQDPVPPPQPLPQQSEARSKEKVAATTATVPAPAPSVRGHYRVSNMLEVTLRDVAKVGAVIKLATDAGANNVWGIAFEIDDPDALRATARTQAIDRAKRNAQELARLGGVKLGKLVSMSESDGGGGHPMMKSVAQYDSSNVPIEGGELTVNHQVQLVYEVAD
jgi:uncharacterized protein YggE